MTLERVVRTDVMPVTYQQRVGVARQPRSVQAIAHDRLGICPRLANRKRDHFLGLLWTQLCIGVLAGEHVAGFGGEVRRPLARADVDDGEVGIGLALVCYGSVCKSTTSSGNQWGWVAYSA